MTNQSRGRTMPLHQSFNALVLPFLLMVMLSSPGALSTSTTTTSSNLESVTDIIKGELFLSHNCTGTAASTFFVRLNVTSSNENCQRSLVPPRFEHYIQNARVDGLGQFTYLSCELSSCYMCDDHESTFTLGQCHEMDHGAVKFTKLPVKLDYGNFRILKWETEKGACGGPPSSYMDAPATQKQCYADGWAAYRVFMDRTNGWASVQYFNDDETCSDGSDKPLHVAPMNMCHNGTYEFERWTSAGHSLFSFGGITGPLMSGISAVMIGMFWNLQNKIFG